MRAASLLPASLLVATFACSSETTTPEGGTGSPTNGEGTGKPKVPNTGPAEADEPAPASCSGAPGELYELSAKKLAITDDLKLCTLKGRVLLIVNGASDCGYTPQYAPLQALFAKYEPQKFTVLAFPSDSFNQEKDTDQAVTEACTNKYGITFPLLTIGPVIDDATKKTTAQPIFKWIYAQPDMQKPIAWNFEKFLVSRDGKIVKRWLSAVAPTAGSEVDLAIQAELAK